MEHIHNIASQVLYNASKSGFTVSGLSFIVHVTAAVLDSCASLDTSLSSIQSKLIVLIILQVVKNVLTVVYTVADRMSECEKIIKSYSCRA